MHSEHSEKAAGLFTILLIAVFYATGAAQTTSQGWTPEVMIEYERLGSTVMSPDGSLVVYTLAKPIMDDTSSAYRTHIWVITADGGQNRQLTRSEISCTNPAFSPDGTYLAFTSKRGKSGKNDIWILPMNGGEAEQITKTASGVSRYRWSPDGRRIAYLMPDPDSEQEAKEKKGKLDMKVLDTEYKYDHLYVTVAQLAVNGKRTVKRLTSGSFHVEAFDWSPDSKTIAFDHRLTPDINDWPTTDISTVPADSGAVRPLVTMSGSDENPFYSPNGKWVAFVSDGNAPRWASASDIYVIAADGGDPRKLAETADRRPALLGWSENSKHVFFAETDKTSRRLFSQGIDGEPLEVLTPGNGNFTGVSFSRNTKQMAFVHEEPQLKPNIYISPVDTFQPTRLTDINADYPNLPMGKTEVIFWKSKDGLTVEGLLTYPVNHSLDKLYPLILNVHGGPAGVFTQTYTGRSSVYPIQAFAQQGYAVLRPNPRGSSGYGKDFRFANYNNWGFGDYDDLITGVNKVMGMGVAHPDSLCVMGWSYGGYMTSFIVTKTKRFKVASVGAGVTNLFSFSGTADIPGFLPDYFGGEPWDKVDTYMKHSPMFQVQGVSTPTQVIHGEEDLRVPLSQGREFYNALKRQGCAAEMIVYPRTAHGPREPRFIQDIGERIIAWFNLHLGRQKGLRPVVAK